MFLLALSIGTGVGFAGCSSPSGFEPSSPQNTGYKLIYPDWTKPVPDDVIPHIIEIGKKYIEVWAPGDLTCNTDREEVLAEDVKEGMIVLYFSTVGGHRWVIGDFNLYSKMRDEVIIPQFGRELANFMDFVNNNMAIYGLILIRGLSGNNAYFNATFIEQGGGKVASFVAVHPKVNDLKRYWKEYKKYKVDCEIYAFHDKNKLDKMMIEIFSHPEKWKAKNPEKWYTTPDAMYKHELEELRKAGLI